jgi:hypothetical protein
MGLPFGGTYPVNSPLTHVGPVINVKATYTFTQPGTYFATVRVASQREGDTMTPYDLIQNLASVEAVH